MNKVVLTGRLTKDPVLKKTTSGKAVLNFSLAVNRYGKDAGADFPNCIAWEKAAELIAQYCVKGTKLGIIGHVQTGTFDDAETGKKIYKTDIIVENMEFLDNKKDEPDGTEERLPNVSITSEELPF